MREIALSRLVVFSLLSFVYALTSVLVPLWRLPPEAWQEAAAASATIAAGVAWAYAAHGTVSFSPSWRTLGWPAIALAIVLPLNVLPLLCDVPWRGDEAYHIGVVNGLKSALASLVGLFLICLVPTLLSLWPRPAGARDAVGLPAVVAVTATMVVAAASLRLAPAAFQFNVLHAPFNVTRYPLLVTWLAAVPAAVLRPLLTGFHEVVYRIVPVLSASLLVATCAGRLTGVALPARLAYMAAVALVPVVFYYSSILYLEMPAVLLLTLVFLDADELLHAGTAELKKRPAWYALLATGFVKETMAVFLGAFLLSRAAVQLARASSVRERVAVLLREAGIAAAVSLPLAVYLAYRLGSRDMSRPFVMTAAHLGALDSYLVLSRAFLEQFGVCAVLYPVGLFLLFSRRRFAALAFHSTAFAGYAAFLLVDRDADLFLGYSRFMLLFAPMMISGLHEVAERASRRGTATTALLLGLVAGTNLLMAPVNLDGTKRPGWGQYRKDTSEHYYPYRAALGYVQRTYPSDRTLVTGLYYHYRYSFELYTGATDQFVSLQIYRPDDVPPEGTAASAVCERLLAFAKQEGFRHVLYHVTATSIPEPATTHGFARERVFQNAAHALVFFSLPPS